MANFFDLQNQNLKIKFDPDKPFGAVKIRTVQREAEHHCSLAFGRELTLKAKQGNIKDLTD